jgi:hemin uptake protein HemP
MTNPLPPSPRQPGESAPRACPPDVIPANALLRGSQEIRITHRGETYRLRITRNDKLILTK